MLAASEPPPLSVDIPIEIALSEADPPAVAETEALIPPAVIAPTLRAFQVGGRLLERHHEVRLLRRRRDDGDDGGQEQAENGPLQTDQAVPKIEQVRGRDPRQERLEF